MRLIDADACIDYIRNNNQHAWEALAYAPTIDAIEIVRCKDCKYNLGETRNGKSMLCNYCSHGVLIERNKNWFCADGERREESEAEE